MRKKNTDDLREELMSTPDLDKFIHENEGNFRNESMTEALNRLFTQKEITKAALAKNAGMSEVYLHQVFSGRRTPSRNRLLCLCVGLSATLEETQDLLKQCGLAQLYAQKKRDTIIIYGLLHGMNLFEINDTLFNQEEETLY